MAEPKHLNSIEPGHIVQSRPGVPADYHCNCEYCQKFMGEIYNTEHNKYYSNRIRKGYYIDKAGDHLDVGHVIGYRWAVQNLSYRNGYVLDPTAGTGTAVVEAILNGRNGIGIELEYSDVGKRNIDHQWNTPFAVPDPNVGSFFRQGDATKLDEYMTEWGFNEPFLDLVINGTPYPKLSGKSSDAPERKNLHTKKDSSFDYLHKDNIGLTKGDAYWNLIDTIYKKSIAYLLPGGYLTIIIKDLVQNKKPYLLHKEIVDVVLASNPNMQYHGFFLHKHIPTTMFINTYQKRFPGLEIPLYQTGIVLRKKSDKYPLEPGFPTEERKMREAYSNEVQFAGFGTGLRIEPHTSNFGKLELKPVKPMKEPKHKKTSEYERGFKDGYTSACSDIKERINDQNKYNGNGEII